MKNALVADIVMAYIVMAYILMTDMRMAYIVMTFIVVVYIVVSRKLPHSYDQQIYLYCHCLYSYGPI